jgi:hypothetical protein
MPTPPKVVAKRPTRSAQMEDRLVPPQSPADVRVHGPEDFEQEFVTHDGYSPWAHIRTLFSNLVRERDVRITGDDLARMSRNPKIHKAKRIIVHGTLTDDLQFAAGATEEEAVTGEFNKFVDVQQFCERMIAGLDRPYWITLEEMLVGALEQGHKIGEVVWEYRSDKPIRKTPTSRENKRGANKPRLLARVLNPLNWFGDEKTKAGDTSDAGTAVTQPNNRFSRRATVRLMPKSIKVKPRNAAYFVVDDYNNTLGIVPAHAGQQSWTYAEVVSRDKFIVLALNPEDSDPRGNSTWRPVWEFYNLANHIPKNYLKLILQEGMPIPVFTSPDPKEHAQGWYRKRDANGHVIIDRTTGQPERVTAEEAAEMTLERMYLGQGVGIPHGSSLKPYRELGTNVGAVFENALKVIYNIIEEGILLQPLAQSAGDVQSKSAAAIHADVLGDAFFWYKRACAVMTLYDLCAVGVRINLGDWALPYMPLLSLGDSEKRDWARDLEVLAKAFWYGFIDESQRAALMAWLGLPKPGDPGTVAKAQADANGDPAPPAGQRPDKSGKGRQQPGDGGGQPTQDTNALMREQFAEVTNDVAAYESRLQSVGHNARRRSSFVGYLPGRSHSESSRTGALR